jgi:hypothetical protein
LLQLLKLLPLSLRLLSPRLKSPPLLPLLLLKRPPLKLRLLSLPLLPLLLKSPRLL